VDRPKSSLGKKSRERGGRWKRGHGGISEVHLLPL
jgi:hypothetical protein